MADLERIAEDVRELRAELVERIPGHFSMRHAVSAFIGALLFGLTFIMKGLLLQVVLALTSKEIILIILSTLVILTGEIYFVGYAKLSPAVRRKRHFGQFWLKRILTYYVIALIVSALLVYVYGLQAFVGPACNVAKLIIAVSMPAAVGASVADLISKY